MLHACMFPTMQASIFLPAPHPHSPPSCPAPDALGVIDETSCSTLLLFTLVCNQPLRPRRLPVHPEYGSLRGHYFAKECVVRYLPRPMNRLVLPINLVLWFEPPTSCLPAGPECRKAISGSSEIARRSLFLHPQEHDVSPTIRSVATRRY